MKSYTKTLVVLTALSCVAFALAQEDDCTAQIKSIEKLEKEVSLGKGKQTELESQVGSLKTQLEAQEESLKTQLKAQEESLTKQYEQQLKQQDAAKSGLLGEKKAIEADVASAKKAVASLQSSIKDKDSTIAKLKAELQKAKSDVDEIKSELAGIEGDLCLPKPVSNVLLNTWKTTKPMVFAFYTKTSEKAIPLLRKTSEIVKSKVSDAASKAYVVISPYYEPLAEKVDEATKPYQPQAKEVYDTVKGHMTSAVDKSYKMGSKHYEALKPKVAEAMTKVKPITEKAASRYTEYVNIVTGHIISFCKGNPQLAVYVHEGNESTIMNTLFYIPIVTLVLVLYSKLRGKKKQKKPVVSSPGRPAFKPQGSPFKATPKAKAYGKRK